MSESLLHEWMEFDNANSRVYTEFARIARRDYKKGVVKQKALEIIKEIRNNRKIKTTSMREGKRKIDNNYASFYARKFMDANPEFKGVFSVRKMKHAPKLISNIGRSARAVAGDNDHY